MSDPYEHDTREYAQRQDGAWHRSAAAASSEPTTAAKLLHILGQCQGSAPVIVGICDDEMNVAGGLFLPATRLDVDGSIHGGNGGTLLTSELTAMLAALDPATVISLIIGEHRVGVEVVYNETADVAQDAHVQLTGWL